MYALKPAEFERARFIAKLGDETLAPFFAKYNLVFYNACNLYKFSLLMDCIDRMNSGFINMPKRVMLQQIAEGKYAEFFLKQVGS